MSESSGERRVVRRRPASYQDVLDAPEHLVAEILDGELFLSPRPASPHALASSVLGIEIGGPFHGPPGERGRPGGWWILDEPELHLGPHVVVPDLAGWRRERMPAMPKSAFFELAPDWACEVLSPSTARADRLHKVLIYAAAGVETLWIVDPIERTLEIFRRDSAGNLPLGEVHEGDVVVRVAPFEAIELPLRRLWLEE